MDTLLLPAFHRNFIYNQVGPERINSVIFEIYHN